MQLFFSKDYFFFQNCFIYAGFQIHVFFSNLVQVLILFIDKLVSLSCVHLVYVMTENIIHRNNSKIQKLYFSKKIFKWHY